MADPEKDTPQVIIVVFKKYDGQPFQTEDGEEFLDQAGKLVVLIRIRQEF